MLTAEEWTRHLVEAADVAGLALPRPLRLPESKRRHLAGLSIHYFDWGHEHKPTVVLLHGGGLSAHTWDLVCASLSGEWRCLALDLPGHGESDHFALGGPGMDFDGLAAVIGAFLDSEDLDRPLMVGHSLGGLGAIRFASEHAELISGLVIVDVGPDVEIDGARRIISFSTGPEIDTLENFIDRAMKFNPRKQRSLLEDSLRQTLRPLPDGRWERTRTPPRGDLSEDVEAAATRSVAQLQTLRGDIPKISCPTLVMRGSDSYVLTVKNAEAMAGQLERGSWVEIKNAGHTVQGDNPRQLIEELLGFASAINMEMEDQS